MVENILSRRALGARLATIPLGAMGGTGPLAERAWPDAGAGPGFGPRREHGSWTRARRTRAG